MCVCVLLSQHKCFKCSGTNRPTHISFVASLMTLCAKPRAKQHTLLQFTSVMNLCLWQPLLHFFSSSVVNRVQIWIAGSHDSCHEMKAGCPHSRMLTVSRVPCAAALFCWKINNSPEISRMTCLLVYKALRGLAPR